MAITDPDIKIIGGIQFNLVSENFNCNQEINKAAKMNPPLTALIRAKIKN